MISVDEQVYRAKGKSGLRLRPFKDSAQVRCKKYSKRLQRAMADFGSDQAFGKAAKKVKEHYGIEVPVIAVQLCTERHAKQIFEGEEFYGQAQITKATIIAETDGSMLPIVETGLKEGDRRKHKRLFWKEARLSLAHAQGSKTLCFAGTMGSVEVAGKQLAACVRQAGGTDKSKVHCVGDGAFWIAEQVEIQFGENGSYLIDFYHLCEYLSEAAATCAPHDKKSWMDTQKERMKTGKWRQVLRALLPYCEPEGCNPAPVQAAYRYINNREKQFDYKSALKNELPIGSGEVESSHRYVLQERLKLAGAWWTIDHAAHMIALRTCRANQDWDAYWLKQAA